MNADLHTLTIIPDKDLYVWYDGFGAIVKVTKLQIVPNGHYINSKMTCVIHAETLDGIYKVSATIDKFETLSVEF